MTDLEYLAVDVGTTSIKGTVVVPETGVHGVVRKAAFPGPVAGLHPLFHEVSPEAVVDAVREVIRRLLADAPEPSGILLCGQMGGVILTSARGEPLSRYVSWLDKRPLTPHPSGKGTYFDVFLERLGSGVHAQLGNEVRPGLPLPFLFWLAETGALAGKDGIPVTLPDFVAARLCGTRPVIEWTGTTGSLDLKARDWPHAVLERLGLKDLPLAEIVDAHRVVGQCDLGSRRVPVFAPVGDHQCALLGTFLGDGELSVNVSTGSQVAMIAETPDVGDFQVRPYFDGRFLKTVTNLPAGRALNNFVRLLTEIAHAQGAELEDPWPYLLAEAERVSETDMEVDLALFPSPVEGPGAVRNLTESNLRIGHLFRAAFEKMAEHYETFAQRLSPRREWVRVVFSGGLARKSALLRRLVGERLGPNRLSSSTEETLVGLSILARAVSDGVTVERASESLRLLRDERGDLRSQ